MKLEKREPLNLTEEDGYAALRGHVAERAQKARASHGPTFDEAAMRALLADPDVVRFPTELAFAKKDLMPGEFAWARPEGDRPSDGFTLVVHPYFWERWDVLPLLIAYHIPSINYLDVVTHEEAELFGATLLGLEVDAYYARLCELTDSIPGSAPHDPTVSERFEAATCSGGACSGSCGGSA